MVSIRDELMLATRDGHILRYCWDGQVCTCTLYQCTCTLYIYLLSYQVNRDYCLDLRRIPFCMDQQVLRGESLVRHNFGNNGRYETPYIGRKETGIWKLA